MSPKVQSILHKSLTALFIASLAGIAYMVWFQYIRTPETPVTNLITDPNTTLMRVNQEIAPDTQYNIHVDSQAPDTVCNWSVLSAENQFRVAGQVQPGQYQAISLLATDSALLLQSCDIFDPVQTQEAPRGDNLETIQASMPSSCHSWLGYKVHTVKVATANFRQGPGTQHDILGKTHRGAAVTALCATEEQDWLYVIRSPDADQVWMSASLLTSDLGEFQSEFQESESILRAAWSEFGTGEQNRTLAFLPTLLAQAQYADSAAMTQASASMLEAWENGQLLCASSDTDVCLAGLLAMHLMINSML